MTTVVLNSFGNRTGGAPISAAQQSFANDAVSLLEGIVRDGGFLAEVVAAPFTSTRRVLNGFVTFPDGPKIRRVIETGEEAGKNPPDSRITLDVVLDQLPPLVLGAVDIEPTIQISAGFFDDCVTSGDAVRVAAVMMHEWMHVAGFQHSTLDARDDVPYMVEKLVESHGDALSAPSPRAARLATLRLSRQHACSIRRGGDGLSARRRCR
jgi:hypothetical protein